MAGLLLDTELTSEQKEYASIIRSSGETLLTLINDILDFSKGESGRLVLEEIEFDPRETIRESCALLVEQARRKGLDLRWTVDRSVPAQIIGDPTRLGQILTNLLGNAVKFTESGAIELGVSVEAHGSESEPDLAFTVRDTGVGIPQSARSRLFHPFTQADGSTTRKYGGTGLGLAICKQLVEMMGGDIGVESEPGMGSTFRFTIRLKRAAVFDPASGDYLAAKASGTAMPARILVVEDNAVNQMVISRIVEKLGHTAQVAANGCEALDALQRTGFDLVLMDCQMPVMDGYTATRQIREREGNTHRTPVVALTAGAFSEDRQRCLAAGMDDYLSKPVHVGELRVIIERWTARACTTSA
jgi:CheY-like chemotaxis protein